MTLDEVMRIYVRMHYDGHLYPPPADVQRNLNLVPLYTRPSRPLSDEQIGTMTASPEFSKYETPMLADFARFVERAHGIK